MKIEQVKKLTTVERFLYWIQERESIRLKKERGEAKPWTNDEILQMYRFCNVRRMNDKVSQWLLKNWYEPNFDHPQMLVACVLARHFNLPASLEVIGFPTVWQPEKIKQQLRDMKAAGNRIFNGAYIVRGIETTDKTEMVVDCVCQPLILSPPKIDNSSMQQSVNALLPYWGFGSFMAGQVVADLRWGLGGKWRDKKKWAPIGPGSNRGINRLLDKPIKTKVSQIQFNGFLRSIIVKVKDSLPRKIWGRLEAIDYQNCLCEFDKYSRTLLGEGRPKQKYAGLDYEVS